MVSPVLADCVELPFEDSSIDFVICNIVLYHIISQGTLDAARREFYIVAGKRGELITIELNSFHPSGTRLNLMNRHGIYNLITGGSDYELALSPCYRRKFLRRTGFDGVESIPVTFSQPRLPIFIQKFIVLFDGMLSDQYPAGFIIMYMAVK